MIKNYVSKDSSSLDSVLPDESYLLGLGMNAAVTPSMSIASCYLQEGYTLLDQIKRSTLVNELVRESLSYSLRR